MILAGLLLGLPSSAGAATITPSITTDELFANSDCSLREAVDSINDGTLEQSCVNTGAAFGTNDTVALQPGLTYNLTINGDEEEDNQTGDLDAKLDLTITGNAVNPPTIRGEVVGGDRVLDSPNPTDLTLRNLNVDDGEITSSATGQLGGNILFRGGAGDTLLLDNVDVTSGLVNTGVTGDGGGGIAATGGGQVTIQNGSQVLNNVVGASTGGVYFGGGIYISGSGTDLTISGDSSVSGNDAGVGGGNTGNGGGIYSDASSSTISISNAAIDNNDAGGGAMNVEGDGGGIAVSSIDPNVSLGPTVSVSNNHAGGGAAGAYGLGGGISVAGAGTLTLGSNVVVAGNAAGGGGADGDGGGINASLTNVSLTGASVASNTAAIGGGLGSGGGIRLGNTGSPTLSINNSSILLNQAGTSGGIGGGILDQSAGAMTIQGSRISQNTARVTGGGIFRGPQPPATPVDSITTTTMANNSANNNGGAIATFSDGALNLRRSTFTANTAGTTTAGKGGALFLNAATPAAESTDILIENSTIHQNTANAFGPQGGQGGGVHMVSTHATSISPSLNIVSSTISDNTAGEGTTSGTGLGGNLYADANSATSLRTNLNGSIVTGGVGSAGDENCSSDFTGSFGSDGGNVEGPPTVGLPGQCALDDPSDKVGVNPLLGPLQDNGGPSVGLPPGVPLQTRAITAASPAFNAVPTDLCPPPTIDQNGRSRPQGTACDSGAFEVLVTPPSTPPAQTTTTPENPECEILRQKIKKLSKKIKRADDPERKAELKAKRRKARKRLAALACA